MAKDRKEYPYTADALEGYFQNSEGHYSVAGEGDLYKALCEGPGGVRQFVVRTPEDVKDTETWSSRGLSCFPQMMPFWDAKRKYLVIECGDTDFFPAMNRVAASIIQEGLVTAEEVTGLFREERIFWSKSPSQLTDEEAAGLFGELFFMLEHFEEELPEIVRNAVRNAKK